MSLPQIPEPDPQQIRWPVPRDPPEPGSPQEREDEAVRGLWQGREDGIWRGPEVNEPLDPGTDL
jgi:hypothetical protein